MQTNLSKSPVNAVGDSFFALRGSVVGASPETGSDSLPYTKRHDHPQVCPDSGPITRRIWWFLLHCPIYSHKHNQCRPLLLIGRPLCLERCHSRICHKTEEPPSGIPGPDAGSGGYDDAHPLNTPTQHTPHTRSLAQPSGKHTIGQQLVSDLRPPLLAGLLLRI